MNRFSFHRLPILLAILIAGTISLPAEVINSSAKEAPSTADQQAISSGTASPSPVTDPSELASHYRQVLSRPEFQESVETDTSTRLQEWISQWFSRFMAKFEQFKYASNLPAFASLLMTCLSVLSLGGLLYIIVRLTRRKNRMEMESSPDGPLQKTFRPPEFYDQEIQEAVQMGDWHGAWLASWRQFLSRLENRQLVESDRTRTNREYLAQLRAQPLPAPALAHLAGMVDTYDRFIYGRQSIGEPDWSLFHRQINEAGLLLHLDEKKAMPSIKQEPA